MHFLFFYFQYILDTLRVDATEGLCNKLENSLYQTIFLHLLTNFFFGMYTLIQTLNSKTNNPKQKVPNLSYYMLLAKFLLIYQLYLSIPTKLYIFNNYFFLTVGTSQMYKNLLETNSSSVMKQLDIIGKHLPNNYTGLVVHTLKSGGNPKSSKHRYISNMTILAMITSGHQNV